MFHLRAVFSVINFSTLAFILSFRTCLDRCRCCNALWIPPYRWLNRIWGGLVARCQPIQLRKLFAKYFPDELRGRKKLCLPLVRLGKFPDWRCCCCCCCCCCSCLTPTEILLELVRILLLSVIVFSSLAWKKGKQVFHATVWGHKQTQTRTVCVLKGAVPWGEIFGHQLGVFFRRNRT